MTILIIFLLVLLVLKILIDAATDSSSPGINEKGDQSHGGRA